MVDVLNIKDWLAVSGKQFRKINTTIIERFKDGEFFGKEMRVRLGGWRGVEYKVIYFFSDQIHVGILPSFGNENYDSIKVEANELILID